MALLYQKSHHMEDGTNTSLTVQIILWIFGGLFFIIGLLGKWIFSSILDKLSELVTETKKLGDAQIEANLNHERLIGEHKVLVEKVDNQGKDIEILFDKYNKRSKS